MNPKYFLEASNVYYAICTYISQTTIFHLFCFALNIIVHQVTKQKLYVMSHCNNDRIAILHKTVNNKTVAIRQITVAMCPHNYNLFCVIH